MHLQTFSEYYGYLGYKNICISVMSVYKSLIIVDNHSTYIPILASQSLSSYFHSFSESKYL